jgi:hypothetical protein
MVLWSLSDVEGAVRESWGADTCVPEVRAEWSEANPGRGQSVVTALVLNDVLGGRLVCGEVRVGGERVDFHWWNRFGEGRDGLEVDLTRGQFGPEEVVQAGAVVPRPSEITLLGQEYELLRRRVLGVLGVLGGGGAAVAGRPAAGRPVTGAGPAGGPGAHRWAA